MPVITTLFMTSRTALPTSAFPLSSSSQLRSAAYFRTRQSFQAPPSWDGRPGYPQMFTASPDLSRYPALIGFPCHCVLFTKSGKQVPYFKQVVICFPSIMYFLWALMVFAGNTLCSKNPKYPRQRYEWNLPKPLLSQKFKLEVVDASSCPEMLWTRCWKSEACFPDIADG